MLGLVVLAVFVLAAGIILMSRTRRRDTRGPRTPEGPSMVYAPGSRDVASEVYWPAKRGGSTMAFPLSKKEEREKTETYSGKK